MQKHISKRRQPLLRTAVYSVMTLSVIAIVSILVLIVLGYSFNQRDGRLEQGGLLQFASIPSGATVTLDERVLGSKTTTKTTVEAGSHSVIFDRQGYRSWRKTIYINPGQIGWLNYARLIPLNVEPKTIRTFASVSGMLASPRHNWMFIKEAPDQPTFELVNLQNDTVQYTTITLPTSSYTTPSEGKTQAFTLESWSQDENAVLIKHIYDDTKTEWIVLDRDNPNESVNVNTIFAITPSKVVFAGNGNRLLFVQTDDVLRRVNLDDQTLSRPLASRVADFSEYDDKVVVYTTQPDAENKRSVGYATTDLPGQQTIHTYPADGQPLHATMKTYFNKKYLSIIYGDTMTIEYGTLPTLDTKADLKKYASEKIPVGSTRLNVSQNGRFVVAELPDGYATYDLELKKYDKTTWAYQSSAQRPLQWLDNFIVWSDNGGQLRLYDFDGANQQTIMPVAEGLGVSISPNDKFLYGINKTDKGFELTRVQLVP